MLKLTERKITTVVLQRTSKECTQAFNALEEPLFYLLNRFFTLSFSSPSCLRKIATGKLIIVIFELGKFFSSIVSLN